MKGMRIRRIGNSNMVALPSELEEVGYYPGIEVLVHAMPGGELRIVRADLARESTTDLARRLAETHRRTLEGLADHDRQG
jgi:antitoxin component of MazEF toxin-antitoxin module